MTFAAPRRTPSLSVRPEWTVRFLAVALLLGGLRDPRLSTLGGVAVFGAVWVERPPVGPAATWMPWLGWAFVSAALSAQPLAALPFLGRWLTIAAFMSLSAAWGERDRREWLAAVLGVSVVLAAAAMWTGAAGGFRAAMTGLIPPYYNYTAFALAAGAATAAAWALHPSASGRTSRWAGLATACALGGCLLLARSRGACLGLAFAAAVWSLRRWGRAAALVVFVAAGAFAGAFAAGMMPAALSRAVTKQERRYQEARPQIWRRAAEIAAENPWFGTGPGVFSAAFRLRPVEVVGGQARWGMNTDYAHSEVLQAAAETGWAGMVLWLFALGTAWSVLLGPAHSEPVREAAVVAVAAMTVQLVVDNMLQVPGLALLFFSAAAVARPAVSGGRRWPRWGAAAAASLLLVAWIPRALVDGDPGRAAAIFPAEAGPREDLAYRAMSAGRLADADARWAEAEARAPFDAVYPWRRAQIAAAAGRWDAAEACAARAASLEPGFLNDRVLRAEALGRLGRTNEARAELIAVLETFHARGGRLGSSGYDATIWDFDRREYDRVAAAVARQGAK